MNDRTGIFRASRYFLWIASVYLCGIVPGVTDESETFYDRRGQEIHRVFVNHGAGSTKEIELFWAKPEGTGPWPAVVFVHGHQGAHNRTGGMVYAKVGRLGRTVDLGYVAAAVSQPGYGNSDGPPDFCGPFSQDAVLHAIEWLRHRKFVRADKIGLSGYSRGAIVASMVATKDTRLGAVVLSAGMYDFNEGYPTGITGLDHNIEIESGTTDAAFAARSAMLHTGKIRAPVLLLHGSADDRFDVRSVEKFAGKLKTTNPDVSLRVFDAGHRIPFRDLYGETYPFLARHLQ